jgi:hypothetical protein
MTRIEVEELARVRLDPRDTLVVTVPQGASVDTCARVKAQVQAATQHERVLVVTANVNLHVLEHGERWPKVVD